MTGVNLVQFNRFQNNYNDYIKTDEPKLSEDAKTYLVELRKQNPDFNFMISDKKEINADQARLNNKSLTAIFTTSEIEKMAKDKNYEKEKLALMGKNASMVQRLAEEGNIIGLLEDKNRKVKNIDIMADDSGKINILAELQKVSDKRKDFYKNQNEQQTKFKDGQEKLAQIRKEQLERISIVLEATSTEEMLQKLNQINFKKFLG